MKVKIQPVSVFPDTATNFSLVGANIRRLAEGGFALLMWQLTDDSDRTLKTGVVEVSGADYQGWNDDDPYLMNLALSKLGLVKDES